MSLKDILRKEQEMISPKELNMTKKLIIIYGIAAGMLYLHLNNIIYRNLNLDSILLDENYYPKISSFDFISIFHEFKYKTIYKELNWKYYQIKYIPKEFIMHDKYCIESEVYSFSFILYEIITKEIPFKEFHSEDEIKNAILNGYRPKFHQIPECYKNLIEACWSEEISKRPSFSQIIFELETNPEFISDDVDRNEFFKYIKSIEQTDIIYFEKFYEYVKKNSKIFNDPYLIIGKISQNSYSKLYKIQNIKKKKIYVCKKINKEINKLTEKEKEDIINELKIINKINHRNILKFIGIDLKDFKKDHKIIYINEYSSNGTLHDYINQSKDQEMNRSGKMINIYGIAQSMKYLHERNIIHGNLSSQNILLDENLHPKLYNFTHSKDYLNSKGIFGDKQKEEIFQNKQKDILAFYLIIYEIITNETLPKKEKILFNIYAKKHINFHPKLNSQLPNCFIYLIQKCWSKYPNERPSFDEIIEILESPDFIDCLESNEEKHEYFNFITESNSGKFNTYINICDYQLCKIVDNHVLNLNLKIKTKSKGKSLSAIVYKRNLNDFPDEYKRQIKVIKTVSKFSFSSILKCIGFCPYNFDFEPYLTIINEYTKISLKNMLEKERQNKASLYWNTTKKMIAIYGIASGMRYIHSKGIIHRNLSLDSILLDKNYFPKISSFDYIKNINKSNNDSDVYFLQSKYASPEVISNFQFSKKSDVFSFSIILYEIITNDIPFSEFKSEYDIYRAILLGYRPKFNQLIPVCYKNLIESCWSEDPKERPSFAKIVHKLETNHDFILRDVDRNEYNMYIEKIAQQIISQNQYFYKQLKEFPNINIDDYQIIEKISQNSYSKLYKIQNIKKKKIYVCKKINKEINKLTEKEKEDIINELKIINKINHRNILKFIGIDLKDFKKDHKIIYINEYLSNGTLHDYINQSKDQEMNRSGKMINIYGIAQSMKYLHERNIIHGNLSSQNILLDENLHPKLYNFTHSKDYLELPKIKYEYSVEEYLNLKEIRRKKKEIILSDKQKDICAFSIIVYEIISNKTLCKKKSFLLSIYNKLNMQLGSNLFNDQIESCFHGLIKKC